MKVSVLVMTYNHEKFIEQALESVLMQQVNFDYEILISEDCSTDTTREIVLRYHQRYPEKIRLLLSEKNLHNNQIVVRGINAAKGDYIALLDGDDYWRSAEKLQIQADYLDRHPECAMCFHNAQVIHEDGDLQPHYWTPADQREFSTLEDMWMGNFIATCSTMFRRGLIGQVPSWYDAMFPITDWPLHLLHAEQGKIGYINKVMGVYRYHSGGLYSAHSEKRKQEETLKFYHTMNANLNFKYESMVKVALSRYFFEWAEEYLQRKDIKNARWCFKNYLSGQPLNPYIPYKTALKIALRIYPGAFLSGKQVATSPPAMKEAP